MRQDSAIFISVMSGEAIAVVPPDPARAGENNAPRILGIAGTFHVLALTFVAVRLYTRAFVVKSPKSDDIVMVVAAVSLSAPAMDFV